MKQILIATSYFPPVAYLSACMKAEGIFIEAFETYTKQTCRNHCRIYGPNGIQTLTVPVRKPNGNHTITKDIRISSDIPWQRIHWRAITAAYNKSPYLIYYQDQLEKFFTKRYEFLLDLNLEILDQIFEILRREILIEVTRDFEKSPENVVDLRNELVSKHASDKGFPEYIQPFSDKFGFKGNLSCLDVIFNLGPEAGAYLSGT